MTQTDTSGKKLVDSRLLANLFGLTPRRIQQLASSGVIPVIREKGGVNRYDLMQAIRGYVTYLQETIDRQRPADLTVREAASRKIKADADLKQAKADFASMERSRIAAGMHRAEDVEAMTDDLIATIRENVEAIPDELAEQLAPMKSPPEISDAIRRNVCEHLLRLSQYTFSPERTAQGKKAAGKA